MPTFHIPDMSCGHCKATIENAISALDPDALISFDMNPRTVGVTTRLETETLLATLADAGYPASPL